MISSAIRFNPAVDNQSLTRSASVLDYNSDYAARGKVYISVDTGADAHIFAIADVADGANPSSRDLIKLDATRHLALDRNFGAGATGTTVLSVGTFYDVLLLATSADLNLYLNGILEATYTQGLGGRGASAGMKLGSRLVDVPGLSPFNGRIGQWRAWQSLITIPENTAEGLSISAVKAGTWGDWQTPAGATRVNDFSGNTRHWTANGTVTDEDGPVYPDGGGASSDVIFAQRRVYRTA